MDESDALLAALHRTAEPDAARAVEHLLRHGRDEDLARINAVRLAAEAGLDDEPVIAALLHGARLGLVEMTWNVLCPSCGGVFEAPRSLRGVRQGSYHCAFCALDSEPVLDDTVEVTFTVSPRVRRIRAHDPDGLDVWDYHRQVFFGSGVAFPEPETFAALAQRALVESVALKPGDRMILSLQVGPEALIVLDPVTHAAHGIAVEGEPTRERQDLALVFDTRAASGRDTVQPGALRLALDNRSDGRVLPTIFRVGPELDALLGGRQPYLTAKRLLSNQTFRDLYRTDTLDIDQRLKILSLTFLFTDLKGSTELYARVGDLVAYDLVRAHFRILHEIVAAEGGAVVKTIGDAVMATFPAPHQGVAAALGMRAAMQRLNRERGADDLVLKIGLHEGPCLAVSLNDRQDYFGQTVNVAARVQQLATAGGIFATESVLCHEEAARHLAARQVTARAELRSLRGIGEPVPVYEFT
ncbi:adenylate/guanylate cyclase domain-containing protein [Methylobacterium nonmethylotrophicum]|uniref:Adenylate/guanylate cyclase domain-containing protein n=1 Tax=Methylobacterium nonmethylotrophicum TaxID=1141884 RepID=A0A4Z0NFJ9_9HYPH|nr:adenylate/guanylate cyclase domain-containing protein [Methylobacterium nonmethylotrophicum]TGD94835.1 adenylate/guanylate cyclase domain-containing protein [Methylobacterium nonmethylotrophicum]